MGKWAMFSAKLFKHFLLIYCITLHSIGHHLLTKILLVKSVWVKENVFVHTYISRYFIDIVDYMTSCCVVVRHSVCTAVRDVRERSRVRVQLRMYV